jgi:hypothetical protein
MGLEAHQNYSRVCQDNFKLQSPLQNQTQQQQQQQKKKKKKKKNS